MWRSFLIYSFLWSCSSFEKQKVFEQLHCIYSEKGVEEAKKYVEEKNLKENFPLLGTLSKGLLLQRAGKPMAANREFKTALDITDSWYTQSIKSGVYRYFLDEKKARYPVHGLEISLIHFYSALNFLLKGSLGKRKQRARAQLRAWYSWLYQFERSQNNAPLFWIFYKGASLIHTWLGSLEDFSTSRILKSNMKDLSKKYPSPDWLPSTGELNESSYQRRLILFVDQGTVPKKRRIKRFHPFGQRLFTDHNLNRQMFSRDWPGVVSVGNEWGVRFSEATMKKPSPVKPTKVKCLKGCTLSPERVFSANWKFPYFTLQSKRIQSENTRRVFRLLVKYILAIKSSQELYRSVKKSSSESVASFTSLTSYLAALSLIKYSELPDMRYVPLLPGSTSIFQFQLRENQRKVVIKINKKTKTIDIGTRNLVFKRLDVD